MPSYGGLLRGIVVRLFVGRLRVDFPLTYNQARVIFGQQAPVPIVQQNRPGGTFDQFWNHRVKEIA